jgi:hypothetical protein
MQGFAARAARQRRVDPAGTVLAVPRVRVSARWICIASGIFNFVLGIALLAAVGRLGPLAYLGALPLAGAAHTAIAQILVVSDRSVEKHVGNIFSKLGLAPSDADHRRVLAVLRYLQS